MSTTNPDIELLRVLSARENYDSYRSLVKDFVMLPECLVIVEDMGGYFVANPLAATVDWSTFLAWARVAAHPSWKPDRWDAYKAIVDNAASDPTVNLSVLDRFAEMDYAGRIRAAADESLNGGTPGALDKAIALAEEYRDRGLRAAAAPTAEPTLHEMLTDLVIAGGYEWRLEDLNRSIGPVHPGDIVLVGARPEVGKTTFLTCELTHMAGQLPDGKHVLWINNEESRNKIKVRLVQSALGDTVADLAGSPATAEKRYMKDLGGHRIDVVHDTQLTTKGVEKLLKSGEYGIVAFNILDKVRSAAGTSHKDEKEVERLRQLGVWARGLADRFGLVVFALAQADASAEGQRILNQSQLYGTKTGLLAESDAQIMIGRDNSPGLAERRFVNVVRNKLPGGPRTEAGLRHGMFEVKFDGERGRYESLAYT